MAKEIVIPPDLKEMLDILWDYKRQKYFGNIEVVFVNGEIPTWKDKGVHKIGEKK